MIYVVLLLVRLLRSRLISLLLLLHMLLLMLLLGHYQFLLLHHHLLGMWHMLSGRILLTQALHHHHFVLLHGVPLMRHRHLLLILLKIRSRDTLNRKPFECTARVQVLESALIHKLRWLLPSHYSTITDMLLELVNILLFPIYIPHFSFLAIKLWLIVIVRLHI